MRRMYFLTQSVDSARRITNELLLDRIPEAHIHVITHKGELPEDLPEATPNQTSDFYPGLFKGIGLGALTALLASIVATFIPAIGLDLETLTSTPLIGAIVVLGALFGGFFGAIVGSSVPNSLLKNFDKALDEEGKILMMADVPRDQVDNIRDRVLKVDPEAKYCGLEPLKPAFP